MKAKSFLLALVIVTGSIFLTGLCPAVEWKTAELDGDFTANETKGIKKADAGLRQFSFDSGKAMPEGGDIELTVCFHYAKKGKVLFWLDGYTVYDMGIHDEEPAEIDIAGKVALNKQKGKDSYMRVEHYYVLKGLRGYLLIQVLEFDQGQLRIADKDLFYDDWETDASIKFRYLGPTRTLKKLNAMLATVTKRRDTKKEKSSE